MDSEFNHIIYDNLLKNDCLQIKNRTVTLGRVKIVFPVCTPSAWKWFVGKNKNSEKIHTASVLGWNFLRFEF